MHYVLDTGFFIVTRDYYPDTFPTFWEKMNDAVRLGLISSVSEVRKELERYGGEQAHLINWVASHANIFTKPNEVEQNHVRAIFGTNDFQNLLNKQAILEGRAIADPFVIAKSMMIGNSVVVTKENPAKRNTKGNIQGSPKIPDVCAHFNMKCILPSEFMRREKWQF